MTTSGCTASTCSENGLHEFRHGDVDAARDAVDFHVGVDKGQKKYIPGAQVFSCTANFLFAEAAEVFLRGQGRLPYLSALAAGGFQDKDIVPQLGIAGQGAAGKTGFVVRMG